MDVSKNDFACCLSVINEQQEVKVKASHKFSNTASGFRLFSDWQARHCREALPVTVVMEATGVYHEQVAWFLHSKGQPLSILVPSKAKQYLRAQGQRSKNDSIDARGLAQLGAERKLELWTPPTGQLRTLRSYTRQHQSLTAMHTTLNNQLHSLLHSQYQDKEVSGQLKRMLALLDEQIREMAQAIAHLVKADPVLNEQYNNITAIKGLGMLSFAVIAAETNGFALFKNAASLVSYAGYDVVENQSGKHVGRTRISKKGNSRIRRVLHMPAFCALRGEDQPQFCQLYHRVYERTRIKMKGFVAVQKKLLVMMYYLWKKNERYDPAYRCSLKAVAPVKAGATHDELLQEALTG